MKKRKLLLLLCCIIGIAITLSIILGVNTRNKSFDLQIYSDELYEHSLDIMVGEVETAQEAKKVATDIWIDEYGSSVLFKMPYRVSLDEKNQVWLVQGSALCFIESGPYILISKSDGRVLAMWDYKF